MSGAVDSDGEDGRGGSIGHGSSLEPVEPGWKHCDGAAIQSIERTINAAMGQKRVGSGNSPGRVKQALGLGGRLRNKASDERDVDFRKDRKSTRLNSSH